MDNIHTRNEIIIHGVLLIQWENGKKGVFSPTFSCWEGQRLKPDGTL